MSNKTEWQPIDGRQLQSLNDPSFKPKAKRSATPPFGFFMTTELCHLSCVMCHFNGPKATRRGSNTLNPNIVIKMLQSRPKGEKIWFVSTGEFFNDPNALLYIRMASDLGLFPRVITHGQLLTCDFIDQVLAAGTREILISVDSIDADQYAKIRRGGSLHVILDACAYLKQKQAAGADIMVGISVISFAKSKHGKEQVTDFWRERADYVQFVSEYYNIFRLRRLFFLPDRRTDCSLSLIPLPSGRVAPCCAIAIYSHDHDVSWLPNLAEVRPEQAYHALCDMYEDPTSTLASLCSKCDWWTQFHTDDKGNTPIYEMIKFGEREYSNFKLDKHHPKIPHVGLFLRLVHLVQGVFWRFLRIIFSVKPPE